MIINERILRNAGYAVDVSKRDDEGTIVVIRGIERTGKLCENVAAALREAYPDVDRDTLIIAAGQAVESVENQDILRLCSVGRQ